MLAILVTAVALTTVQAYSVNGHLAVANIAQDLLEQFDQTAMDGALAQLVALQEFDPELVYREANYPFIECATFADDIKYHGGGWQGDFHFEDHPWVDQAGKTTADYPGSTDIATRNLTEGITNIVDWLSGKNGDAYKTSYMYTYITENLYPNNTAVGESYALRLLVHFLGDIHQPLHSMSRYNDNYPEGDKGANDFPLPYHYEADELHALWDKGIYELRGNIARPIATDDYIEFHSEFVAPFEAKYPYTLRDPNVANQDFDGWAVEGWTVGTTVYAGVTENEVVPQAYIDTNVPIMENMITLGGYRLAHLMIYIYSSPAAVVEETFLQ